MGQTAQYEIKVNDRSFQVESSNEKEGKIDGTPYELDLIGDAEKGFSVIYKNRSYQVQVIEQDPQSKTFTLKVGNSLQVVEASDRFDLLLKELGMEDLANAAVNDLKAPMPGLVLALRTEVGASIKKGDPLIVLEAMKMENVLKAEGDATVKSIAVEKGQAVEKNQILIELES